MAEEEKDIGIAIGKKLKDIRKKLEWKQETVEDLAGIRREYLSRIESPEKKNGYKNLQMKTLERLLAAYEYSLTRFFSEIEK